MDIPVVPAISFSNSEQMHLGASHHQVRKILDLALSLTIDWKKNPFGSQNHILKAAGNWVATTERMVGSDSQ